MSTGPNRRQQLEPSGEAVDPLGSAPSPAPFIGSWWIVSAGDNHTPTGVIDGFVRALHAPYGTAEEAYAFLDGYRASNNHPEAGGDA